MDHLNTILGTITSIISTLIPLFLALATLAFVYGILKYVLSKDETSKQDATKTIFYGLIFLFVMVSVWGLVSLLRNSLGISSNVNLNNGGLKSVQEFIEN